MITLYVELPSQVFKPTTASIKIPTEFWIIETRHERRSSELQQYSHQIVHITNCFLKGFSNEVLVSHVGIVISVERSLCLRRRPVRKTMVLDDSSVVCARVFPQ